MKVKYCSAGREMTSRTQCGAVMIIDRIETRGADELRQNQATISKVAAPTPKLDGPHLIIQAIFNMFHVLD